ncbi:MAG: glutamate synthase subunit beta [Nevskiaceae bacterium]|nr:MAG: glutamate synthase subunit beta [Nevskiaceae bacterium]TBR72643.1 MAG: glutamate synthase subunit beta [Nevskiaceae bacterium]
MGKITGFMEYERTHEHYAPVSERLKNFREFIDTLDDATAQVEGARCMDCGIPFCHNGCPVNNIIPQWNDLVYHGDVRRALEILHSTNNFPDFTGRICPAPCEEACTLNYTGTPVGIKSIERYLVESGWKNGWIVPQPAAVKTGKRVAIVGSGPSGLAAAQQLARTGHDVTVFEKNDRIGGLLRYGIPGFKLEKKNVDRRLAQLEAEGVKFRPGVFVGKEKPAHVTNLATETIAPKKLLKDYDAVLMCTGCEAPRDLPIAGRELNGVHFAMEFLPQQNRIDAGDTVADAISAKGKHVVVIGGGDTGSDCVGTSHRQGAKSITQIELMPRPPEHEDKPLVWPYWPIKLRTSSSHEEGCERDWSIATKRFEGKNGKLTKIVCCRLQWEGRKMAEIPDSEFEIKAELVLLAMGFVHPPAEMLDAFGVDKTPRGNANATEARDGGYRTNVDKLFAAGDTRRGQSLVVWAIREGRQAARAVDEFLMGTTELPR